MDRINSPDSPGVDIIRKPNSDLKKNTAAKQINFLANAKSQSSPPPPPPPPNRSPWGFYLFTW